jgi:toxin HigB-1
MIRSFRNKGLKELYETGKSAKINQQHKEIIRDLLFQLDNAVCPEDMNTPGNNFHQLKGELKYFYSVAIRANWKMIFKFEGKNAFDVDYLDYH